MEVKTGKARDVKDQFYTNRSVSLNCIQEWLKQINVKDCYIIEPSAGDGS